MSEPIEDLYRELPEENSSAGDVSVPGYDDNQDSTTEALVAEGASLGLAELARKAIAAGYMKPSGAYITAP